MNNTYTIYCKKCYNQSSSDHNYCPVCGEPLKDGLERNAPAPIQQQQQGEPVQQQTKQNASTVDTVIKGVVISFVAIVAFIGVAGLIFFGACMLMISGLGG